MLSGRSRLVWRGVPLARWSGEIFAETRRERSSPTTGSSPARQTRQKGGNRCRCRGRGPGRGSGCAAADAQPLNGARCAVSRGTWNELEGRRGGGVTGYEIGPSIKYILVVEYENFSLKKKNLTVNIALDTNIDVLRCMSCLNAWNEMPTLNGSFPPKKLLKRSSGRMNSALDLK